jgi:stage III sporulation protein SpoIIIAA
VLLESQSMSRYKPGDWIEGAGGTKVGDYVLPEITTLLLVGPRGAGKSTLVNRITRVFDKDVDPFAPDRVQVSRKLDNLFKCCFSW